MKRINSNGVYARDKMSENALIENKLLIKVTPILLSKIFI